MCNPVIVFVNDERFKRHFIQMYNSGPIRQNGFDKHDKHSDYQYVLDATALLTKLQYNYIPMHDIRHVIWKNLFVL